VIAEILRERYWDYTVPAHCAADSRRHIRNVLCDTGAKNIHFDTDKGWLSADVSVRFDATSQQWNEFCQWSDTWAQTNGMVKQ
jgi:hypothetical protein